MNHTGNYHQGEQTSVTRIALGRAGRDINLESKLLLGSHRSVSNDMVAETFEAIIGAVYADSGDDMKVVLKVLEAIEFVKNVVQPAILLQETTQTPPVATTEANGDLSAKSDVSPKADPSNTSAQPQETEATSMQVLNQRLTRAMIRKGKKNMARKERRARARKQERRLETLHQERFHQLPETHLQPSSVVHPQPVHPKLIAQPFSHIGPDVTPQQLFEQLEQLGPSAGRGLNDHDLANASNTQDRPDADPATQHDSILVCALDEQPLSFFGVDDTAAVPSRTESSVDNIRFPVESLAQSENHILFGSLSMLNNLETDEHAHCPEESPGVSLSGRSNVHFQPSAEEPDLFYSVSNQSDIRDIPDSGTQRCTNRCDKRGDWASNYI